MLTYKRYYDNIRHVKRKDVKTDRQTRLRINPQKVNTREKKLKKVLTNSKSCVIVNTTKQRKEVKQNEKNKQNLENEQKTLLAKFQ